MSLEGTVARVSAAIKPDVEGEVMADIAGGTQAFPARSYDSESEFQPGERVLVLEKSGGVLYVAEIA